MLVKARNNNFLREKKNNFYYRDVYLKSDHWKFLREEKLLRDSSCEECGEVYGLDVHHKNYRGLYDVKINDLVTLCRVCHNKKHKNKTIVRKKNRNNPKKKRNNCQVITKEYIKRKSNRIRKVYLSLRNLERQKRFDKTVFIGPKEVNNYVSIHY